MARKGGTKGGKRSISTGQKTTAKTQSITAGGDIGKANAKVTRAPFGLPIKPQSRKGIKTSLARSTSWSFSKVRRGGGGKGY